MDKANEVDIMVIFNGDGQHDPSSSTDFVKALTTDKGYCYQLTVSEEERLYFI